MRKIENLQHPKENRGQDNNFNLDDLNAEFSVDIKHSLKFLRKVYGILLIQFIVILGLILIFQIKSIKNYIRSHSNFFWALLSISTCLILIMMILYACDKISNKVPVNYIQIIFLAVFFGLFFALLGSKYNFHVILGIITCLITLYMGLFFFGLLYKGDNLRCCHNFWITFLALLIHYGIVSLIFKGYYLIFLYDTIGVFLYSIYIDFDILTILKSYSNEQYTLASMRLTFDTIAMITIVMACNSSSSKRKYGSKKANLHFGFGSGL